MNQSIAAVVHVNNFLPH